MMMVCCVFLQSLTVGYRHGSKDDGGMRPVWIARSSGRLMRVMYGCGDIDFEASSDFLECLDLLYTKPHANVKINTMR